MRLRPAALISLLLLACDPAPPLPDGGGSSGRGLPGCVNPDLVTGMTGLVSIPIDTRNGEPGLVSLPCTASGSPAPQWVVAYTVPGSGPHAIEVSTVNAGTDVNFDTVVAVRRTCWPRYEGEPADGCFDDQLGTREFRSRGSFVADGGETLFIVVTGYGEMAGGRADEGLAQLDVTALPISPPTLTEASVLITPESIRVDVVGGDEGRDASGVYLTFHGPAGELLDLDANGVFDSFDVYTGPFDRPVLGSVTFTETATLESTSTGGASFVRVRLIDRAGVLSDTILTVPARLGSVVGLGEVCDATHVCGLELACDGTGTCSAAPDRVAACAAAISMDLVAPTDGRATSVVRQSVLNSGPGLFGAQCSVATGGREDIYAVRVPPGTFDVILTTDSEGTSGATLLEPDTILYVRRTCTDATSGSAIETECNDDIESGANQRSTVEIRDLGDVVLSAFVEIYNGATAGEGVRYELRGTLRPVLEAGMACDPAGLDNRCAAGTCPVATRMCP